MKGILWVDTEVNGKNVRTEYIQKYISYEIKIEHPFLLIPVKIKEETERLSFYLEDQKVLEYQVFPLEEGEIVDYYAPVPVASWIGRTIRLEGNYPEAFYAKMKQADRLPQSEQLHPLMHFSPVNGWMNDPNGLVCQDGIYHLFYQHNAFGTKWDNMSWGHAVSEDLLHWEHRSMAILPDEDGTIFTGSGLCNEKGLLELPENALVFFYTSAGGSSDSPWSEGRQFTQRIAYSTDRGETLHKKNQVIVPNLTRGNRDPKVYWHEESKGYIMSLYLKDHEYAILRSEDLEHWELTQKLPFLTNWMKMRRIMLLPAFYMNTRAIPLDRSICALLPIHRQIQKTYPPDHRHSLHRQKPALLLLQKLPSKRKFLMQMPVPAHRHVPPLPKRHFHSF